MLQIYYNGEWVDWKSANIQWNGAIFENGGFSPKQPITKYDVAYKNRSGAIPSADINNSMLTFALLGGNTGGASVEIQAVFSPDEKIDFDKTKYSSITITGTMSRHITTSSTWEFGLCNSIPSSFDWDSVSTTTVASISTSTTAETTKDFTVTIPVENITGEKYLCFRNGYYYAGSSASSYLKIQSMTFNV